MQSLHLRLLGSPEVKIETARVSFSPERRYQLLAYLACAGEWVSRDKLAYLFWPDHSDEAAHRNLRKAVFSARRLSWLESLEPTTSSLRWLVETDVSEFQTALNEERLEAALALYHGPFLQGMELKAEAEFATWLELERQRLHGLFRTATFNHADALWAKGKSHDAVKTLQRCLEHDALDEEAVQKLLMLLAGLGETKTGANIYQAFVATLERELGLEPSSETRHLAETLQNQKVAIKFSEPSLSSKPLFTLTTSFVGRGDELTELSDLLRQSDCRLLTLLGAGGVGKTRLAFRLAESLANAYQDGVYVVRLEAIQNPDLVVSTIAETLGFTLRGAEAPETQLQRYLASKEVLLVLDNFEQLVSGAALLSSLLAACPRLKLLVTSRECLHLAEEWLLPLEGLNYPRSATITLEEALNYDAIQLFVKRAKQVQPHFMPTSNDLAQLVEIVQRLEGFPLGIELAAVWVRHLTLSEIAKEIRENTDFLQSQYRNVSERQQSVRATFEHSWKLLNPKEQEVLARLSLFQGGFSKEAAMFVTGALLPILTSLVDKSLLRIRTGRYDFHELIRQYAAEKLKGKECETTLNRHATFYAEFVAAREKDVQSGAREVQVLADLELELSNIRLAWQHATKRGLKNVFDKMMLSLRSFYAKRGPSWEGEEMMRSAAESLEARHLKDSVTLGRLLSNQALFSLHLHEPEQALSLAERSLSVLESCRAKADVIAFALWNLSYIHLRLGESFAAEDYARKSLEYNKRGKNPWQAARSLLALSEALQTRDPPGAEGYLKEAIAYFREADDKYGLGLALHILGALLAGQKRWGEAKIVQEEGIRVYQLFGRVPNLANLLNQYGETLCAQGNYQAALELYQQSLAFYYERHSSEAFYSLERLGEANLALGEARKALGYFLEAFHFASSFDDEHKLATLVGMAEAFSHLGEMEKAVMLGSFTLTKADPDLRERVILLRERVTLLLKRLEPNLPETDLHALRELVASWQWADVATFVRGLHL